MSNGVRIYSPVIVFEPRPPVGRPQQRLYSTGQIHKQVTHQEEPCRTYEDNKNNNKSDINKDQWFRMFLILGQKLDTDWMIGASQTAHFQGTMS